MGKRILLTGICLFALCTQVVAAIKPLVIDRGYYFDFNNGDNIFEKLTPTNLNRNDNLETIFLKFVSHNLKMAKNEIKNNVKVVTDIRQAMSEYKDLIEPKTSISLSEEWETEFRLKADLPRKYVRMNLLTAIADGEMSYYTQLRIFEFKVSRNITDNVVLSVVDSREIANRNNKVMITLAYDF